MTKTIRFENVSKKYRLGLTRTSLPVVVSERFRKIIRRHKKRDSRQDFWAIKDVSFELGEGESLALVGRNGAGKTTILKLLSNITKPTRGTIEIRGQLSALIELGAGFHHDLTGRENIFLNGTILGLSKNDINQRFDEILDFSELEQFIDTPVKRYSSGMVVRLGFAVASCIKPNIILVDEVLAVGDASFQQKCMRRINKMLGDGTSIIFVSHNLYLVQAVCERAIYLDRGEVRHHGTAQEVIAYYEQDLHKERARKLSQLTQLEDVPSGEGDIEITNVEIRSESDSSEESYLLNHEPLRILVHYNAYNPLGKAHVSVFIIRADGLTCCMLRTKLDGFRLDVDRGQGTVSVTLDPLQLVSGSYFVEAWFLNDTDSIGITTKPGRSEWFNVKGSALSYTETSGIYEPNTKWEHIRKNGNPSHEDVHSSSISH